MTLPEEVRGRLAARAATDLDIAALLEMCSKPDRTLSEPSLEQGIEDVEIQEL
jgi:hypothetical protein